VRQVAGPGQGVADGAAVLLSDPEAESGIARPIGIEIGGVRLDQIDGEILRRIEAAEGLGEGLGAEAGQGPGVAKAGAADRDGLDSGTSSGENRRSRRRRDGLDWRP
jgi:hypothetical protein